MMNRHWFATAFISCLLIVNAGNAQEQCVTYKWVPQTTYKTRPVDLTSTVNETVMESKQVITYKPVWTRETRHRTTTTYKPIVTTSEREERYLVRRPIIETTYKERKIQETSYETVTEMTEKRYLVESPAVETQMREEQVVVRKPVTTTLMQSENVTTYKPTTVSETQLVAGATIRNDLLLQSGRNRLRRLQPGIYVDPATGQAAYRKRGLHWVPDQNLILQPTVEPTLVPQTVTRTTYTPETVTVQKPFQVTQYVDQIEKRQVPVQVATTSRKIHVVKIPVTVQKPVVKIRTEKVPVQEVRYREEVYTRKVPVTATKYQRVEQVQPYEVDVCKWVAETSEVQVPKTVARRVDYSVNQIYPETKWIRVPVDIYGNALSAGEVVATEVHPAVDYQIASRIANAPVTQTYRLPASSDLVTSQSTTLSSPRTIVGKPMVIRKLEDHEFRQPTPSANAAKSILVPETQPIKPTTETVLVEKRPTPSTNLPQLSETEAEKGTEETSSNDNLELPLPPAPTSPDESPNSLDVEASDDGDIETRPGDGDSNDQLDLNGSED